MAHARFDQIKAMLNAWDRVYPPDRETFLNETCAEDPDLRETAGQLFDERFPSGRLPDGKIGPYRLEREIGRGGMGVVYLASRADDQFDRRVAIKLLHPGVDSGELLDRFRNERQILANLDHPNICRLFDGGIGDSGEPYLVMEYVRGAQPIDEYCDRHRLTIRDRVRLFVQVCDAVRHAHRILVVHRDLKPDNILISSDGHVKLMDFGLAKNLFEPLMARRYLMRTTEGAQAMTPAYASPEQIRGDAISTGTDVYALGVILYELLTGSHPFDARERGNIQGLMEAICNEEPDPPSVRVQDRTRRPGPDAGQLLDNRKEATSRGLMWQLRGDLDWVILTAMRKDPERRYASVDQLREDLQAFIEGFPVKARPDSWRYRAAKFVRRHLAIVVSSILLFALTIGFGITMAVQARRIAMERDTAEQVSNFLVNTFKVGDPDEERAGTNVARDALDQSAERIGELGQNPEVQSRLLLAMGEVFEAFAEYGRSRALIERSLEVRRRQYGADSLEVAESYKALGELSYQLSSYEEAENHMRRSLEIRRRQLPVDDPLIADSLNGLGMVLVRRARFEEAEMALQEAIEIRTRRDGEESDQTQRTISNLGLLYYHREDYGKSQAVLEKVLEARRRTLGNRHHRVALTLNRLGQIANASGDYEKAEKLFREALSIQEEKLRPDHPLVAITMNNLASLEQDQGDFTEAEQHYRRALAISIKEYGPAHSETAVNMNNLATLLESLDRFGEADSLFQQSFDIRKKVFGLDHVATARAMNHLARISARLGRFGPAESLGAEALGIRLRRLGPKSSEVASSWYTLGQINGWKGAHEKALEWHRKALDLRRMLGKPQFIAEGLVAVAEALMKLNRPADAEPLLREAVEIRGRLLRPGNWLLAATESRLGGCLLAQRRYADATPFLVRSDSILRKRPPTAEIQEALQRLPELRRYFR